MEKITKILIWNKFVGIFDKLNWKVKGRVYDILLYRNSSKKTRYYDINDLHNISKIEIFKKRFLWITKKILLNEDMLQRVALYLSQENNLENSDFYYWKHFDCMSFSLFLKWIEYKNNYFEEEKFDFIPFSIKELEVGDMVYTWILKDYITKYNITSSHSMIYLWDWLYISKYWQWRLIVTNLKEYKKIFPYDFIYILRLKQQKNSN